MNRVLVTGAGGFIGRRLLSRFAQSDVLIRATSRQFPPDFMHERTEWVPADLADETLNLQDLCGDCHYIVHLAGLAHKPKSSPSDYQLHNYELTSRLVEAAVAADSKHFIFVSTAGVFGESYEPGTASAYSEEDEPSPRDPYAASKLQAENMLMDAAERSGICCTILRPPLVYGPGVPANFRQLMRAVDMGLPLPLGSVNNLRSLIFVDNLCDLIYRLLNRPLESNKIYNVSDAALSAPGLIKAVSNALSVKTRLIPFPVKMLMLAGKLTGRSGMIERLTQSFVVDDSLVRRELQWEPPVSPEVGMRITADWYQKVVRGEE